MTDGFTLAGLGLGIVSILALFVSAALGRRTAPNLAEGAVTFLSGAAICAGIKICLLAANGPNLGVEQSDRIYVFLGGLAVVWVSFETIMASLVERSHYGKPQNPAARADG
jgi:uncharacterized membrane protein (DUF441 family)